MARLFDDANTEYLLSSSAAVSGVPATLAAWFLVDDLTNGNNMLSVNDTDANVFLKLAAQGDTSGDPIRAHSHDGSSSESAGTNVSYSTNTWEHACAVFSSSSSRAAFLNGANKATDTVSQNALSGLDNTSVGTQVVNGGEFGTVSGRVAEAAIWNVALTDDEVAALGANGVSPLLIRPANLVFYMPLIRDEDINLIAGEKLSVTGSPGIADHYPGIIYPSEAFAPMAGSTTTASNTALIQRHRKLIGAA